MTATAPRQSETCLSDLALDRMVAGGEAAADAASHLEACPRCRERLALLEQHRDDSTDLVEGLIRAARHGGTRLPDLEPSEPRSSGFPMPRLAVAALVVLAVTASAVWMLEQRFERDGADTAADTLRIKGSSMRFFVQRGDEVVPGVSGDRYREGDALRFTVSNDQPVFFFLVGIEESGKVSAYVPYDGERSEELPPGIDAPMPGSLVLDGSDDTEYFVGLFTAKELELAEIERAIGEARSGHDAMEEALEALPLPGQHRWVIVHKESP